MFSCSFIVLTSLVSSPHHMGPGMGPAMGPGMGSDMDPTSQTPINIDDYNEIYTVNNDTLYESNTTLTPDSDSTDNTDFSLPMGIGASLGIIGLIITLLNLKKNKLNESETEEDIYIEPVTNESHQVVTNESYESSIVNIDDNYETIQDTLYEFAN